MWQRSPNTASMSFPSFPSNVTTHAHSPRLCTNGQQKSLAGLTLPMVQSAMFNVANHVEEPTQASYIGPLPNKDEIPGCSDIVDAFDDTNAYFDWPGKVGLGLSSIPQQFTPAVSKSSHNWERLGETNMPGRRGSTRDSSGSGSDETQLSSLAFSIDEEDPKVVPKTFNTPILAERNQPGLRLYPCRSKHDTNSRQFPSQSSRITPCYLKTLLSP